MDFSQAECTNLEISSRREWLLTNGIGGFAMSSLSGINTRRYHGLLVAATVPPVTRMVLLAGIDASITTDGTPVGISSNQYPGTVFPQGYLNLKETHVGDYVRSSFEVQGSKIDRIVQIHEGVNAVTVRYVNTGKTTFQLKLNPLVCHKPYHENFLEQEGYPENLHFGDEVTTVSHRGISLIIKHPQGVREAVNGWYFRFEHEREVERGLDPRDDLFCPCELVYTLSPGEEAVIMAGTDGSVNALPSPQKAVKKFRDFESQLRSATEKFIVEGEGRSTIIAGYPWFTDWGRDTMIALPGLLLHTNRASVARRILSDFSTQMSQGLIPNRFVEQGEEPAYNTVDATLWYVNAIYLTLQKEWHQLFAVEMFEVLKSIYEWHVKGTYFGIKVADDGLLTQGEGNVQLTWMDAKINDWVVTPRHGKPVEINGLWINALHIMEWLADKLGASSVDFKKSAKLATKSFDKRFWHPGQKYYLDTVDPDDASLRPNQLIAMSLPFAPAKGDHAKAALAAVERDLLTPFGLRTLSWQEPGYQGRYQGPLPNMDAAYHQGTVWPWLFGPYITALVKIKGASGPEANIKARKEAREILKNAFVGANNMLRDYGVGGVAEVYDGDAPQRPNGCPFQAWSVAEILRAWVEDCALPRPIKPS